MNQLSLFNLSEGINILPFDGEALFYSNFISLQESEKYFNHITDSFQFKQEKIKLYDKEVLQPRLTAVCGYPYRSLRDPNVFRRPQPWTKPLLELKEKIEPLADTTFTHALFNLYRDGNDHVSWHRDNERKQGENSVIASLSLGVTRTFQFRHFSKKEITRSVELTPGSLIIMRGKIQHHWEHRIPKTTKRIGARINITFRVSG